MRLHLLQGVVAFHQGKTLEATQLLNQAKEELQKLSVSDADLTQLIGLGKLEFVNFLNLFFLFFEHIIVAKFPIQAIP